MTVRWRVRLRGRVQGVGMRYFVKYTASLHDVSGWVRNLGDGSVELEAEGDPPDVEAFLLAVEQGNRFSEVDRMDRQKVEPEDAKGFTIEDGEEV